MCYRGMAFAFAFFGKVSKVLHSVASRFDLDGSGRQSQLTFYLL
jgi:hypothetical protein